MKTTNPVKAIQNELNPILKKLSAHVDLRAVRNIGKATVGRVLKGLANIGDLNKKSMLFI